MACMSHREHIDRAIKIMGGQAALGKAINYTQQGISYLRNKSTRVPGEVAVAIHAATNGEVSKADLRPDLFGRAA